MCQTPAAVIAVVEDAVIRRELHWPVIEDVFARLISVSATAGEVRLLMQICGYEWLYEMPIEPRRFIQLKADLEADSIKWQHVATHLICFEFDSSCERAVQPPFDNELFSETRIVFYFDNQQHLLGWERPRKPGRSVF